MMLIYKNFGNKRAVKVQAEITVVDDIGRTIGLGLSIVGPVFLFVFLVVFGYFSIKKWQKIQVMKHLKGLLIRVAKRMELPTSSSTHLVELQNFQILNLNLKVKVLKRDGHKDHISHSCFRQKMLDGAIYVVARDGDLEVLNEFFDFSDVNKFGKGGLRTIFVEGLNGGRKITMENLLRYFGQGSEDLTNEVDLLDIIFVTLKLTINLNSSLVVHIIALTTLITKAILQEVRPLDATIEVQFSDFRIIPKDLELLFSFPIQLLSLMKNNFRYCVLEIMFGVLKDKRKHSGH
ncbi:hypothetical protein M5689_013814 [Euphorbia peplus]|nr:hypothetical protein M5689_013814 [Euphorbia peplus]